MYLRLLFSVGLGADNRSLSVTHTGSSAAWPRLLLTRPRLLLTRPSLLLTRPRLLPIRSRLLLTRSRLLLTRPRLLLLRAPPTHMPYSATHTTSPAAHKLSYATHTPSISYTRLLLLHKLTLLSILILLTELMVPGLPDHSSADVASLPGTLVGP